MTRGEPVTKLKGVGPKKAEALHRLSIHSVSDLITHYPREYQDRRNPASIASLKEGQTVLLKAKIRLLVPSGFGRTKHLQLLIADETGELSVVFFHAGYLMKGLKIDDWYEFYGKVALRNDRLQLVHPEIRPLSASQTNLPILPIYPLVMGLRQTDLQKWMAEAFRFLPPQEDYLPGEIRKRQRLCDLQYALEKIHFPEDPSETRIAKFRLIFDEFFFLMLGLRMLKQRVDLQTDAVAFSKEISVSAFTKTLPFALTGAQSRVLSEIEHDMEQSHCMNRLVQGDVGSGKTAIAAAAAYKAIRCGYQAAMMAPTELLAVQHYKSFQEMFQPHGIRVGCLTGSLSAAEKRVLLTELKEGRIDFLLGTHALIQEKVEFDQLGLVITDEQHRFGVRQRSKLSQKGGNPDILVMTATPIPRTLAVILYGDLDVSAIDELPPGRKPVVTKTAGAKKREDVYRFVQSEIDKGRQVYVVAPLIAESTEIEAISAEELFQSLKGRFGKTRVQLLHGSMKQAEKDTIMEAFVKREADVLVSTVVIEVGINVPNASVMVIENAERFGLATLHQLRGRVGRGAEQSYCFLLSDAQTPVAKERLQTMCQTNDGFLIAEKDLELRGTGEFFGFRQHGLPELKLADPGKHRKVLQAAKEEAFALLDADGTLSDPEHFPLKDKISQLFQSVEEFSI